MNFLKISNDQRLFKSTKYQFPWVFFGVCFWYAKKRKVLLLKLSCHKINVAKINALRKLRPRNNINVNWLNSR